MNIEIKTVQELFEKLPDKSKQIHFFYSDEISEHAFTLGKVLYVLDEPHYFYEADETYLTYEDLIQEEYIRSDEHESFTEFCEWYTVNVLHAVERLEGYFIYIEAR